MLKYLINFTVLLIGIVIGINITKHIWGVSKLNSEKEFLEKKNSELVEIITDNSKMLYLLNSYNSSVIGKKEVLENIGNLILDINQKQDSGYFCGYRVQNIDFGSIDNSQKTDFLRYTTMIQEYGIAWDYLLPKELTSVIIEPKAKRISK
ncbi:hypothetical protein [Labilibaculum antarcticum]|uniref:Uncharacterized protein n=1 Tax=Labilibaculum antarcticum TaxID=1717717 RepID=A0A1Y1CMU4_9BACT|nr:hypothetical protein [Labilibaculum antarcticum]BAX81675.1 hypothetical protein ALGA_3377 [Labilibaculum antarcticum]